VIRRWPLVVRRWRPCITDIRSPTGIAPKRASGLARLAA
jgi:hypothetical protein